MILSELRFDRALPVDGYAPGGFRIGGRFIDGAVLLRDQDCQALGNIDFVGLEALSSQLLALSGQVDVIIIGCGASMRPLPGALHHALEAAQIGVEPMATPSACRAHNMLLAEGRRVASLLLPMPTAADG